MEEEARPTLMIYVGLIAIAAVAAGVVALVFLAIKPRHFDFATVVVTATYFWAVLLALIAVAGLAAHR